MAYDYDPELSFIQTLSASSSASIVFSSGINSSNFQNYVVKLRNIVPATNATDLLFHWSVDGGGTYLASPSYATEGPVLSTITRQGAEAGTATLIFKNSSTATNAMNGELFLCNMFDAANHLGYFSGTHVNSDGNIATTITGIREFSNTANVNAVKFTFSSGNIASGTFILYGVNEP